MNLLQKCMANLTGLLVLLITPPISAENIVEKTFSGEEILSGWEVINIEESPLGWNGLSDEGATITFHGGIILQSAAEYYNVRAVTVAFSSENNRAYFYPPEVGTTTFDSSTDEKDPSPMIATAPDGTIPMGRIKLPLNSSREETVTVKSITIEYDADGAQRNLKWSETSVTARLGEPFTAPTLTGDNTEGVTYSSSDKNVAYIDSQGIVSLVGVGTTTITASAPADGLWLEETASYTLTVTLPSIVTETINVSTPGTLNELLVDLDTRPGHLILTGKLNSSDLSYITHATGKMGTVKVLDLSAISLDYDNNAYNSISGREGSDIGLGSTQRFFYLSETCRNDTTSSPTGLGGFNVTIKYYNNNLAGLFANNTTLESVILPESLPGLGCYIFSGSAISNVSLPTTITEIPENAFLGTSNLTLFNLPSSVTRICNNAFSESSIKELSSGNIVYVGDNAFNKSKIESFDFSAVQEIGNSAFAYTSDFSGLLNLPKVKTIGESCFANTGFSSVVIGNQLDSIPYNAFSGNISSVNLPESIRYIGEMAFYGCDDLKINIPSNVTFIGSLAFPTDWLYRQPTDDGVWYFGKVAYKYDPRIAGVETLKLKPGIKSLSPGFPSDALRSTLKTIEFPDGFESIGTCYDPQKVMAEWRSSCFSNCENLVTAVLPEGLQCIGDGAFYNCPKLTLQELPVSVKSIGQNAFYNCTSIYGITLGEDLSYLGEKAFEGCTNISELKLYSTELFAGGNPGFKYIEKVTIGANVTHIPSFMFYNNGKLIRAIFEDDDLTEPELTIGDYAFYDCSQLKLTSLPKRTVSVGKVAFQYVTFAPDFSTNNIREIGEQAFYYCKGITSLTVTSNLEKCGSLAFSSIDTMNEVYYDAPRLVIEGNLSPFMSMPVTKVTIGPNVEVIPASLFYYQPNLTSLTFAPREDSTRAGNSLRIEKQAFSKCNIKSLELPDVSTVIEDGAFAENTGLKDIRLGNGTEKIGNQAFQKCASITSVDIPSSVVSIGEQAFYPSNMAAAYLHFRNKPDIGYHAFAQNVTVYVQEDMMAEYQSSGAGWSKLVPYAIESFSIDRETAHVEVGKSIRLNSNVAPSEYSYMDIQWTSSDPAVAVVSNGVVAGLKDGQVTITASIAYMEGYTATCTVAVGDISAIELPDAEADNSIIGIFDLNGLYIGTDQERLSPGIYVIKRNSSIQKIIVK